jgi:prolyl oligopeptidase
LPESKYPLSSAFQSNKNLIVVKYLKDGAEELKVYQMPTGEVTKMKHLYDIKNPGLGEFAHVTGKWDKSEILFKFHSFTNPGIIFKYDFN